MALSVEDIRKVAFLARLSVSELEIPVHVKNLSRIMNFISQMDEQETKGVLPMAHPLDATQVMREDKITEINQRESFQSIAPLVESGLYLVPKVIE